VKFLPGVDSRADGGYIIAAPSAHISGNRYQWKHLPPNDQFPTLPTELLLAINGFGMRDSGSPRFDPSFIWEGIPEGQRDDQLFRYACKMRHNDTPRDLAERLIIEAAACCNPPFPKRDALKKVDNAYRQYPSGGREQNNTGPKAEQSTKRK